MKFYCERYPQLYVRDLGVRFVDGVFETDDAKVAERLRNAPLPLTWDGELTAPEPAAEATEEGLIVVGGGYYELPNGERVRGREAALEALAALEE